MSVTVPVHMDAGEDLADECLAADVYFGDDKLSQSIVSAVLVPGTGSDRTVRILTTSLINEPVVTVYLAAGCKSKVSRKFVAFADPPGLVMPPVASVTETATSSGKASTLPVNDASVKTSSLPPGSTGLNVSTLPPLEGAQPSRRAQRAAERRASAQARAKAGTAASADRLVAAHAGDEGGAPPATTSKPRQAEALAIAKPSSKVSRALSAKVDAQPAKTGGARLELDPVEADAVVAPMLMMTTGLGNGAGGDTPEIRERRAAAAALWTAMNASPEQLARDRQRMQDLEQRLQRLQQDSAGANEKVVAMEARVRQAEEHRLSHPLVYALAAACALLLLAVGWLFTRQRRISKAQDAWWQAEGAEGASTEESATLSEPEMARTAAEFMPVRGDNKVGKASPAEPIDAAAPLDRSPELHAQPATTADTATRPISIKSEAQEAVREITVEELIDLEQQAEFFVVLGQDEAAIELLESHVQTTAGASPLPHLKLLEIYQRLGRRADYERVQTAFNGRFNAYAPSWESDLQGGHTLSEYPGVVERLQSLWSQPARAMEVLQSSLTRPDDSVETFDLPAYRELLFLYAVARDLSERDAKDRAPVDLVLPTHEGHGEFIQVDMVAPLMATRPVKAVPAATPSLSLDLSLDDPVPLASDTAAVVDGPITQHGNTIDFDLEEDPKTSPKP